MTLPQVLTWLQSVAPKANCISDSRMVKQGDIFFAYPGDVDTADGRQYIAHAVQNGAAAILYEAGKDGAEEAVYRVSAQPVPHLGLADLKMQAGYIANAYYAQPDAGMYTIAVTGTNGKTSCTQWLASALSRLGEPVAVLGTLGAGVFTRGSGKFETTGYTTPDAVLLQRKLAEMRDAGAKTLAMEASSIGLDQGRMNGMHIDLALFTNLTRDHLDYHVDMAAYEAAKTRLFDWPGLRHAILNLDDPMGLRLARRMQQRLHNQAELIAYSVSDAVLDGVPILRATDIRSRHAGTEFHVRSSFGSAHVKTQLVGLFNVSNILGVLGALLAKGIAWNRAISALEELTAAPGRMEQLGGQDAPMVVIDYAHTPDALGKTLLALRSVAQERAGQLWCVFGCGGDRDPGKRPQMGAIAEMADHIIVTSDNPRSEDPQVIMQQVVQGMTNPQNTVLSVVAIEDRAAAILSAVKHAAKNDVILLAGKGHETYQEIKGKKLSFSDTDHAALALATRATMKKVG